jgi:hypothetical protein
VPPTNLAFAKNNSGVSFFSNSRVWGSIVLYDNIDILLLRCLIYNRRMLELLGLMYVMIYILIQFYLIRNKNILNANLLKCHILKHVG